MITKKGFNVFVAIVVIVSSNVCTACFSENVVEPVDHVKTGASFLKVCHCEKPGYSVKHIKWIDPKGRPIKPLGTNTVEKRDTLATGSVNTKIHVVPIEDINLETGTERDVFTETDPIGGTVSLQIESMSTSKSGTYICETEFEGAKYTKTYNVQAHDSLYFVNTNATQHVILGEDSLINCEVKGNTDPLNYYWELETPNYLRIESDSKYNITAEGPLVIRNASDADAGTYRCIATELGGNSAYIDQIITVELTKKPIISELRASPSNVVLAGSSASIQCVAEGTPHPEYFWSKIADWRGKQINATTEENEAWRQDINTILFDDFQKDDAGTYECISANKAGSARASMTIDIHIAPEITFFDDVNATEGSIQQISCRAIGTPVPNITISYHGNGDLQNDSRIQLPETKITEYGAEMYLTFSNVSKEFAGIYSCQATNDVDNATEEMNFTVFYQPYFEEPEETVWGWIGKTIDMNCTHESNPTSTKNWTFQANEIGGTSTAEHVQMNRFIMGRLNNNNESSSLNLTIDKDMRYGVYECLAENEYGTAKKIVHIKEAFPPGAITNVTLLNKTASSMTFDIEGPVDSDGPPVVGYEAQYDTSDNYNITNIHINRTWSLDRKFIVERLKPMTTYTFKFAAKNEAGVGEWTETIEFETPETSVPEPPTWDESQTGNGGNLRWKSPEANGNPIDHYIIEYCPFYGQVVNYSLCKREKLTTNEFSLGDLNRNTTYSFKIWAHNLHGESDFVNKEVTIPEKLVAAPVLSAGAIIGLSIVVVFVCLLLFDLLLLCWRRQGVIASCYYKKNKKKDENLQSRDKKVLLVKEGEARPDGTLTQPNNGHREFEYNKNTGVITGKHSTV